MSAARHAVFAEGVGKLLDRAEEIAGISIDKHTSRDTILAKATASAAIPELRAALFPED